MLREKLEVTEVKGHNLRGQIKHIYKTEYIYISNSFFNERNIKYKNKLIYVRKRIK